MLPPKIKRAVAKLPLGKLASYRDEKGKRLHPVAIRAELARRVAAAGTPGSSAGVRPGARAPRTPPEQRARQTEEQDQMKPKPNTMRSIQRGNRRSIQLLRPGRQAVGQGAARAEANTPRATPVTAAKARIKRAKKRHYARGRKEPYKLTLALIRRFCEVLRSCPGLPVEAVCDSVGITRTTYYAWLEVGRKE